MSLLNPLVLDLNDLCFHDNLLKKTTAVIVFLHTLVRGLVINLGHESFYLKCNI